MSTVVKYNSDVRIIFTNDSKIFEPNGIVSGNVEFDFIFPKDIKSIFVEIFGHSETLMEKKGTKSQTNVNGKVTYKGEFVIVHEKLFIIGRENTNIAEKIPAGHYSFPFLFALPSHAPPTFATKYGKIEYYLRSTVIKGSNEREVVVTPFFVQSGPIDLRHRHELYEAALYPMTKSIGICCCISGEVNVTICIEKRIFKPGQLIRVHVDCENGSTRKIEGISLNLMKNTIYSFQTPKDDRKTVADPIASAHIGVVAELKSETFDKEIQIPSSLKLVDLKHCKLMKQVFVLAVKVAISGPFFCLQNEIPIEIADIVSAQDVNKVIDIDTKAYDLASAPIF